ncbi:homocysteine S-methyltransferase family protein [bacterium]|nr:homocysteine S-methyltransferase family protein [bacterium]
MSAAISGGGTAADTPAADRLRSIIGKRLLIADGSTGTALEAMAPELAAGGRLALLPLERPDLVEALHDAYFAAGADLVETATFSASARDIARFAGERSGEAAALCYDINRAAAAIAARSARRAEAQGPGGSGHAGDGLRADSHLRLVAGSIGPGDAPPSLGASTYAELFESYLPQARGLADGGADLAIVETCQDPLQIKAALAALGSPAGGRGLPFIVSATVDDRGRMLAGADVAAFVAIVAPFAPLALGLNCSGGPDELEGPLAQLAALSPFPLCLMPNAGLPCSSGGCTTYPFGPELFAAKVEALARRFGLAIAGGCCGTTPAHIAALHERLADRPVVAARPPLRPALASLYSARNIGPGLFKIGERANSAGSAAFAALLDAEDFEGMAEKALAQETSGATAIDLHLSRPGRDEAADLERLVALIAPRAQAALCLDSGDPEALERVLPLVGGRPLLNSTSLEDPGRARRVFALASRFGAAVVCLAMDGAGPARTVADKVRVCRVLYDMATGEFGLQPQALLFDPLTFTIAAGGDPAATIAAIGAVKAACPGSLTVLGVGNVSYGLPKSTRAAVTSLFLDAAVQAGLDAAIMDTAGIPAPDSIDPGLKTAALTALGLGSPARVAANAAVAGPADAGPAAASEREPDDRLDALLAWAAEKAKAGKGAGTTTTAAATAAAPPGQASGEPEPADPASRLKAALSRGDKVSAEALGREVAALRGSAELMGLVTEAMAESGRLWNEGRLSLPLVLRSAEAARRALGPATEGAAASATKGIVVMATVKGDLHDIGKNIVAAILACSGWKVVDLGTDVPTAAIVKAAQERGAIAVGLSGLLTRSLVEMRATCAALASAGSKCLVLCGGAAVSADFVAREMKPLHPGLVSACPDAFAAAELLDRAAEAQTEARAAAPRPSTPPAAKAAAASHPIAPKARPAYEPPFLGAAEPRGIPFPELLARLSHPTLFAARWGYGRQDFDKAEAELSGLLDEAEALAAPRFVYGYYPVKALGETILLVGGTAGATLSSGTVFAAPAAALAPLELPFPRESGGARRTLASYFRPEGDCIAFFAATAGPELGRRARELKDEGKLEAYWHLHGLGSALAEAAAQYAHDLIGAEILAAGGESAGKRYSFGFPACPGLEYQAPLLELLGARRIGLSATSGHQLDPEHSVTAFVIAREDATYFGA